MGVTGPVARATHVCGSRRTSRRGHCCGQPVDEHARHTGAGAATGGLLASAPRRPQAAVDQRNQPADLRDTVVHSIHRRYY